MLIGLISDDDSSKYIDKINKLATYCKTNFRELNVNKTKEVIIDIRKSKALPDPIIINDHTVEHVCTYKYLGVMLNNDLSWSNNTDFIISKQNSHLYCLRKHQKFNIEICIFIRWLTKLRLKKNCVCWGGNIPKLDIHRITGII